MEEHCGHTKTELVANAPFSSHKYCYVQCCLCELQDKRTWATEEDAKIAWVAVVAKDVAMFGPPLSVKELCQQALDCFN
jgi:hypothetical protein